MFQQGELVRWFLMYDVGIVKESGIGTIIEIIKFNDAYYNVINYKVLRSEHSDVMFFEQHEIEKFKE
tara:strand:- start:2755 stop:2955 length:201 start_codon:yes stop_codon:yes gene_type:complete